MLQFERSFKFTDKSTSQIFILVTNTLTAIFLPSSHAHLSCKKNSPFEKKKKKTKKKKRGNEITKWLEEQISKKVEQNRRNSEHSGLPNRVERSLIFFLPISRLETTNDERSRDSITRDKEHRVKKRNSTVPSRSPRTNGRNGPPVHRLFYDVKKVAALSGWWKSFDEEEGVVVHI